MAVPRLSPRTLLLVALVVLPLVSAVVYSVARQIASMYEPPGQRLDHQLLELHQQAIRREISLLLPQPLDGALVFADFSPRAPAPRIPRAELTGGAVVQVSGRTAAVVRYQGDAGPFTLLTWPADLGTPPGTSAVVLRGQRFESLEAEDATLVIWRRGAWFHALGSQLLPGDRELFVDLARRSQGS